MFDSIVKWIVEQVVDKKRITVAVLAGINLVQPTLREIGVEVPESLATELGSWVAILVLALWSKMNARKAENPG
jgi:hypothetical protein